MNRLPSDCALCGSETRETRVQLVEWTEPIGSQRWSVVPRCVDRVACRSDVETREPWPVADSTPAGR
jgi:hypothetical protein